MCDLHLRTEIQPKLILCLEGGYNCVSVAQSFIACIVALLGARIPNEELPPPSNAALDDIIKTARAQQKYWPLQCQVLSRTEMSTGI